MMLEISAVPGGGPDGQLAVRAVVVNDSYEPIALSRNGFTGPTLLEPLASGMPQPTSVEPTHGGADEPITLQPFTFYGRERWFDGVGPGAHEFEATYDSGAPGVSVLRSVVTVTVPEAGD